MQVCLTSQEDESDKLSSVRLGPFGSLRGCPFDEGCLHHLREVRIFHSARGIHGLLTTSRPGASYSHGTTCSDVECSVISLADDEQLTSVSGTIGSIVFSLSFTTSMGRFMGPYGSFQGWPFGFNGLILGFFGTCDTFINAIGAHCQAFGSF